ncbi:hypothetical protein C8T65DRAFT_647922 [Cerioporus squamosus]|nr:hypothetical protein C8T65DRAFT_647922 [Cerioporus squamosus]
MRAVPRGGGDALPTEASTGAPAVRTPARCVAPAENPRRPGRELICFTTGLSWKLERRRQ